jgi:hypothetical protein
MNYRRKREEILKSNWRNRVEDSSGSASACRVSHVKVRVSGIQYSGVLFAGPFIITRQPAKMPTDNRYYNPRIRYLKFPSACKSHNIIWIILLPDLTKPPQIPTIHRLQRCSKQRVIDIRRRILQVLSVLSPGFDQRSSRTTHGVSHQPVYRCVSPAKVHAGWEDGERAVWWVSGWPSMGEEVRLEWLATINEQHAVIVFPKSIAPELIKNSSPSERTNALICATFRRLLTLVSFLNALMMGSVYCNMGTPSK